MTEMLEEAERLYGLGFAVHWIKPNSKAPVKSGWSGPKRDDWETLCREYQKGYGLGVRLGAASKLPEGGYLANIDVDLKSSDSRHVAEAQKSLDKFFPGIRKNAPTIKTGAGVRFVVRTEKPAESRRLASSSEKVDYFGQQKDAWQVEFMSAGKQVVLPPSVHPDTKKPYLWIFQPKEIPLISAPAAPKKSRELTRGNFQVAEIDLEASIIPDHVLRQIQGEGVEDRSAALLSVAMSLCRLGFSDSEILTVLTDRDTMLGETAYDHAQTGSRARAAEWVRRFTLAKARAETDAAKVFDDEVTVSLVAEEGKPRGPLKKPRDWKADVKREKEGGPPLKRLENVVTILGGVAGCDVFKRDLFANRDSYTRDTPWGGKKGEALTDDDAVKIRHWLGVEWRFEPPKDLIFDAMVFIATKNGYHPVRDELLALPGWDGVPRLDTWLAEHFSAKGPSEYLAQVFRKWMVAAVARIYKPGLKFDWMPIFEGAQGTGKSSFGAILFGQSYFTDWLPPLSDKDAALALQGKRCAEFGELDQLKRNELETTKAFITRQVDNVRPPYGRRQLEIYRQCVFFGTTNKKEYLKDDTGNRRFNPVKVGLLDFEALHRDREQLWAEALFTYWNELEPSLYLDNGAEAHAHKAQAEKMVKDDAHAMAEAIKYWRRKKPADIDFGKFAILDLFELAPLKPWKADMRNLRLAGQALEMLGGKKWKSDGRMYWKIPF